MRFLLSILVPVRRQSLLAAVVIIVVACTLPFSSNSAHAATLRGIEITEAGAATQIILQLDEKVRFKQQFLPGTSTLPDRCYVDLYSSNLSESVPTRWHVDNKLVSRIRTGIHATTLRVVLDLKGNYNCVVETASSPFDLRLLVNQPATAVVEQNFADNKTEEIIESPISSTAAEEQPETATKLDENEVSVLKAEINTLMTETESTLEQQEAPAATEVSFWGWAQLFSARDTAEETAEDNYLSRIRTRLGADWNNQLAADYSLQLKGAVELDRLFYADELADEKTEVNLHETYLQLNGNRWDVSFGKQRVRWGKSDQLSPVDSINPQDYRQSLVIDLEERAIPSWLLRSRWYGENIGVETIVQPWFQKSEIEYFDSDWALYRNLRQSITSHPSVLPALKDYARSIYVEENKPSNTLENMSAGIRLSLQTEQTDYALSYHYGWETLPTISSFPVTGISYNGDPNTNPADLLVAPTIVSNVVQATYKRQQTVGFEWETVLDPVGFRGEIAYIDKVAFMRSDLTSERKAVTHLVGGVDYTSENEWYFNLQGSWQHIHDFSKEILYFEENTLAVLGEIRKPIWRGNLELATKYNYIVSDQSSYLQPSVTLKYFPNIECEVGVMVFSGNGDTLLGSYDRADQAYAQVKISF